MEAKSNGEELLYCRDVTIKSYNQKKKTIKGMLNNVSIEHEKIGRIMQDGSSALDLDEGDLVRVSQVTFV